MERLALTAAELAFLFSFADEPAGRTARVRLRLSEPSETAARDGLASLAVRGLVQGTGARLALAPAVAGVLRGLTEPTLWVEISAVTRDAVAAAQLYVYDRGQFLLSPRAYGTFEVLGVRPGVSPVELLVGVARRSLGGLRPALIICRGATSGSAEPTEAGLAALADGGFAVSGAGAGSQRPAATLDVALHEFGAILSAQSPAMAGA